MQQIKLQPKQMGTVHFDSDPHGANIYVDGQILTDPHTEESVKTPANALLYEGRRDYTISLQGYEDESGYVDVYPGTTVNVYKRLKQGTSESGWGQPQPQIWLSQQTGNITITTNPSDVKIYIDGVLMKEATPAKLSLNVGYRYIVLEKEGYFRDFNRIYIHPGAIIELSRNLSILPYPQYASGQMQKYIKSYFMSDVVESLQGPTMGTLVITSYPAGATIEMDGKMVIDADTKEMLKTPVQIDIGMGQHNFIFRLEGYCNEFGTVYILPDIGTKYIHKTFYIC
jgi:archaellum component FlaG (FlaF/FlaG flagellin family)